MPYMQTLNLTRLLINPENPRFEEVNSQIEALKIMIDNQGEKLFNLALDIVEAGLNPSDIPIVTPSENKDKMFLILEGNRRITALKLLVEPSLIVDNNNLKRKFVDLSKQFKQYDFKEIDCIVFETDEREEAYRWIRIKHSGEMNGVGTVSWNAASIARFNEKMGAASKTLQVLDYVKEKVDLDKKTKSKLESIAITNLDRLISDPQIRDFLGIDFIDNKLHVFYEEDEVMKGLKKIIKDLVYKRIDVNDIYYKDDRRDYLESFQDEEIPDRTKNLDKVQDAFSSDKEKEKDQDKKTDKNKSLKKGKRLLTSRKTLIPIGCMLRIEDKRLRSIYKELKSIYVDKYTNAVAVLFRVFLELSLDYFIENNNLEDVYLNSSLSKKVQIVAEYFTKNNILDKNEIKPANIAVSSPNSILSIDTFHAYVHNKYMQPIPKDLKLTWDNIETFIEKIWENK